MVLTCLFHRFLLALKSGFSLKASNQDLFIPSRWKEWGCQQRGWMKVSTGNVCRAVRCVRSQYAGVRGGTVCCSPSHCLTLVCCMNVHPWLYHLVHLARLVLRFGDGGSTDAFKKKKNRCKVFCSGIKWQFGSGLEGNKPWPSFHRWFTDPEVNNFT